MSKSLARKKKTTLPARANPWYRQSDHMSSELVTKPEIVAALLAVKPRYRPFAVAYGCGCTVSESAGLSGFDDRQVGNHGYRLLRIPEVKAAVDLISLHASFIKGGIALARKRAFLWDLAQANAQNSPNASVAAMKLLAAIDGDIAQPTVASGSAGITINISGLNVDNVGEVIDGAVVAAGRLLEHDGDEA